VEVVAATDERHVYPSTHPEVHGCELSHVHNLVCTKQRPAERSAVIRQCTYACTQKTSTFILPPCMRINSAKVLCARLRNTFACGYCNWGGMLWYTAHILCGKSRAWRTMHKSMLSQQKFGTACEVQQCCDLFGTATSIHANITCTCSTAQGTATYCAFRKEKV
jgi:hypothetical protein